MNTSVGADLEIVTDAGCELELQIAVARTPGLEVREQLTVTHELRGQVDVTEIAQPHDGRMHVVTLPPGTTRVSYAATTSGEARIAAPERADLSQYRRPSRYAAADTLGDVAVAQFGHVDDRDLLEAISSWVGTQLSYVPGSSGPTDGANETLQNRQGVCRDYAHLVVALLRALGVPARMTAVYAPGCDPMDFHAVVEAFVSGGWYVADATALAPRSSLVRIATGRDAADTAFMATSRGMAMLTSSVVTAVADDGLPSDDLDQLVRIG